MLKAVAICKHSFTVVIGHTGAGNKRYPGQSHVSGGKKSDVVKTAFGTSVNGLAVEVKRETLSLGKRCGPRRQNQLS